MNIIKTEALKKSIKGALVLNHVDFQMESGKIYGLVGKNGSGKTMLIRALSGLMRPTEGRVLYNHLELYKDIDYIPSLGIVVENAGLYPEFTGFKNLQILAAVQKKITDEDIKKAIARVGLDPEDKRTVKKYSLGMKQRIVLAQAIMERPDVLLLDEPTNALDESGIEIIRNICREEAARGAIVLIASHNKEDIESLCDFKYRMEAGRIFGFD
ncbi:MAG: ABC transporter ATP-binding protein [Oscillospiraceae bacterium]|nr:ABC transporter ATP-binding protein [Oscillospiraceae bacterium]